MGADDTAQLKPVTVARSSGEDAVIERGVAPGDRVVTEGQNQLRPGAKVAPVEPAASEGAAARGAATRGAAARGGTGHGSAAERASTGPARP